MMAISIMIWIANQPEVLSVDEFHLQHERDVDFGHRVDWYDKLLNKSNLGQSHYLADFRRR